MERFVGEVIRPKGNSFNPASMAIGEPGLPEAFVWKGRSFTVQKVLEAWKELGKCTHRSQERYLRKHWYRIRSDEDVVLKVYFQRQSTGSTKSRWRLYSLSKNS